MAGVEVAITVEHDVARWRPLVQWLLAVPILAFNGVCAVALVPATFAAGLAWTVTGRSPRALTRFQHYALDTRVRAYAYFFVLRATPPPLIDHDPDAGVIARPDGSEMAASRAEPLVRLLRVAPLGLVLIPLAIVMDVLYPVLMVLLVVRGGWPQRLASAYVAIEDVVIALLAYVGMASDRHPLDRADTTPNVLIDLTALERQQIATSRDDIVPVR